MDKTNNTTPEEQLTADQTDAFIIGWDDEPAAEEPADQPETTAEEDGDAPAAANAETDQPGAGQSAEEPKGQDIEPDAAGAGEAPAQGELPQSTPPETPGTAPAPQTPPVPTEWRLKHLDSELVIPIGDPRIPGMLQKSMDYDRVRAKWDEAKPIMEMFSEFARSANMSVQDYARYIRTEAKKASGMDEAQAKRVVELEEREAAISAKEAATREAQEADNAKRENVRRDLNDFSAAFPDVFRAAQADKNAIPAEVWAQVDRGSTLTAAYARYAVAQAQAAAAAAEQRGAIAQKNADNAARSTGSLKSAGNTIKTNDPFLEGWGD